MVKGKEVQSVHWSGVLDQKGSLIPVLNLPSSLIRFTKFCFVGATGMVVDMGILYLLADPSRLGWNITLSKICAAEVAMINNFIWNELWTFRHFPAPLSPRLGERDRVRARQTAHTISIGREGRDEVATSNPQSAFRVPRFGLLRRFLLFNAICGVGIGLAVLLLHLFHSWLGWNLYLSNLLAILLITCWNFGLNSTLTWREQRVTAVYSARGARASGIDFGETLNKKQKHKG